MIRIRIRIRTETKNVLRFWAHREGGREAVGGREGEGGVGGAAGGQEEYHKKSRTSPQTTRGEEKLP